MCGLPTYQIRRGQGGGSIRAAAIVWVLVGLACDDEPGGSRDASIDAAADDDAAAIDAGSDAGLPTLVDPELADPELLALWGDWAAVPLIDERRVREHSTADRGADEVLPLPLIENGNKDMNNFVCRGRHARASAEDPVVPFHFDLDECPEDWVEGFVVARSEGFGGFVSRIWATALSMSNGGGGTEVLRVYRDDDTTPALQARLRDLADGLVAPFEPPRSAYDPSCVVLRHPIAFDHRVVVTLDDLSWLGAYYAQVDVQRTGDARPRWQGAPLDDERALAAALVPAVGQTLLADAVPVSVAAGETHEIVSVAGGGTVAGLEVGVASLDDLAPLSLVARFDDAALPAIDVPLVSLTGAALGAPAVVAPLWAVEERDGAVVASFALPMPYRTALSLALRSAAAEPIDVVVTVRSEDALPPDAAGTLHAVRQVTTAPADGPHPIVSVQGRGTYVGTWLYLEGHPTDPAVSTDPLAFLEGDPVGWADGEPAIAGTGTEDYPDSAFYFSAGPFAALDAGLVRIEPGRVATYRMHLLTDAIGFDTSFDMEIEVGPGDPAMLDRYETVAFFYLDVP